MQIFYITKLGCNVSIKVYDNDSGTYITYFEDSSNVLMQLNPFSSIASIQIKGTTAFTSLNITANNCLYMNSSGSDILISDESAFTLNYALVFACATGGGGGGNQNLQQVTDVGNVTTNDIYVNSVYYNDFAAPDQYGRLNINDFAWIFTDIDNVARCVIQEGAIALKNKVSDYLWRLDSLNLTKNLYFQMPDSLSGRIQDIIPISVNGVYADINGDIQISPSGVTGINGLNGTTNIGLGGTLLNDTSINGDNYSFEYYGINGLQLLTTTENSVFRLNETEVKMFSGLAGFWSIGGTCAIGDLINNSFQFITDYVTQKIYAIVNGTENGFLLDYNNRIYQLGDFASINNGLQLILDDNNNLMYTKSGNSFLGYYFDFNNSNTFFGSLQTGVYLNIDYGNELFNLVGTHTGFIINTSIGDLQLGDNNICALYLQTRGVSMISNSANIFDYDANTQLLRIGTENQLVFNSNVDVTFENTNIGTFGLYLSASTRISSLGDYTKANNGTFIGTDDINQYLIASTNLKDVDTGNPSGKGIRIFVNGEQFTIPLNKI